MSLRKLCVPFVCTALVCLLAGNFSSARAAEGRAVDAKAEQILKASMDYLKEAKGYTFHAEITVDTPTPSGVKVQYAASWDVAVRRPDRVRTAYHGDIRNSRSWYDGKTFTLMNLDRNFYAQWEAPSNVDELIDKVQEKLGVRIPLNTLLRSNPFEHAMSGVQTATYLGLHRVHGEFCHHIVLTHEDLDVQVWIADGSEPVVRKVVLTFKNAPEDPQFTAYLSEWDLSAHLPDIVFSFIPPEGAAKIDFMPVEQ